MDSPRSVQKMRLLLVCWSGGAEQGPGVGPVCSPQRWGLEGTSGLAEAWPPSALSEFTAAARAWSKGGPGSRSLSLHSGMGSFELGWS